MARERKRFILRVGMQVEVGFGKTWFGLFTLKEIIDYRDDTHIIFKDDEGNELELIVGK